MERQITTESQSELIWHGDDKTDESHEMKNTFNVTTDVVNAEQSTQQSLPGPLALTLLMTGVSLACFLVALDRTIVATAIPQITDEFGSPGDVGWYGSAYLLTSCAFQPSYGYIFSKFDARWSFLTALGLFELGSLVSGLAPTSTALILGRAVAGVGCAGVFAGSMVIIAQSTELKRRPVLIAIAGSIFGLGSICGPIVGGALTNNVTWRWCFYLNLPAGVVTFVALLLFFRPARSNINRLSFIERVLTLDWLGNLLIIGATVCLLLALQWGGAQYAWDSPRIIGLLVGSGVSFVLFGLWQWYRGPRALLPLGLISQRTVAASFLMSFFLSGTIFIHNYFLPFWFQVIRGDNPVQSGVHVIPYVASSFVASMIAGIVVQKTGYFTPPAIIGPLIAIGGSVALTQLKVDTQTATWIGYEILASFGIGMANQQGIVATQAVIPDSAAAIGSATIIFAQSLAGAIFVSVGDTVIRNELSLSLASAQLPGVDVQAVLDAGLTNIAGLIPSEQWATVLSLYNNVLDRVFIISVPLAALAFVSALGMEWKNIAQKKQTGNLEQK